jgi:hypothetical protein
MLILLTSRFERQKEGFSAQSVGFMKKTDKL